MRKYRERRFDKFNAACRARKLIFSIIHNAKPLILRMSGKKVRYVDLPIIVVDFTF